MYQWIEVIKNSSILKLTILADRVFHQCVSIKILINSKCNQIILRIFLEIKVIEVAHQHLSLICSNRLMVFLLIRKSSYSKKLRVSNKKIRNWLHFLRKARDCFILNFRKRKKSPKILAIYLNSYGP